MIEKIQGTDGIRREIRLSNDTSLIGLSPLEAFLKKDIITEKFVELYAYSYVRDLIDRKKMSFGEAIVVGWDPRDKSGIFTNAALEGVKKAGGKALNIGIVPTPLVPIYMINKEAKGGIMITASHNPPDQNGIKLFVAETALKPLPHDDFLLTQKIISRGDSELINHNGPSSEDQREEAIQCFNRFSLAPLNSWVEEGDDIFSDTIIVVDPANGSFSGIAAYLLRQLNFKEVIEVSADLSSEVNLNCGVVELEGMALITPEQIGDGGKFINNQAVVKMFNIGRKNKKEVEKGKCFVSGAIFDADGDRFIRLDYDPFQDSLIVLSGDESAFHQATFLSEKWGEKHKGRVYVNTVESDLNVAAAAKDLGYTPLLTGVGDKWILLEAFFCNLMACGAKEEQIEKIKLKKDLCCDDLAALKKSYPEKKKDIHFCVGAEESGHGITEGYLIQEKGKKISVFCGNGFKSAVNCFVATHSLLNFLSVKAYYQRLAEPFASGFKKTFYAYYTDHTAISTHNPLRIEIEGEMKKITSELFPDSEFVKMERPEEPNMIYLSIKENGQIKAGIYIRNSGTEDKTGINLRGRKEDAEKLLKAGELLLRFILKKIKAPEKIYAQAEMTLLTEISKKSPGSTVSFGNMEGVSFFRLLKEVEKGGLVVSSNDDVSITETGSFFLGCAQK